jgi:hypothetical protein
MSKQSLLDQLSWAHQRAETAHLELVVQSKVVAELEKRGRDTTGAKVQLARWRMREQKYLRQMDWILDQLDA